MIFHTNFQALTNFNISIIHTENKPVDPFTFAKRLHSQSSGSYKFLSQSRVCTQYAFYISPI